jgi:hypothetical protein
MVCTVWKNFYEAKCSIAACFSEDAIFEHVLECPDCMAYREKMKKKSIKNNEQSKKNID